MISSSNYDKCIHSQTGYIFKDCIERVFEVFRTPELLDIAHKKLNVQSKCLTGKADKYDNVGSIFTFRCQFGLTSEFVIEDSVNTDEYKMIQLYAYQVTPVDFQYRLKLNFYKCSISTKTVYIEEIWYYLNTQFPFQFDQKMFQNTTDCKGALIEEFLKTFPFNLVQAEGISIKTHIDTLWDIVTDWGKFIKTVPRVADTVTIEEDPHKLGTVIYAKSKKVAYKLRVVKCEGDSSKKSFWLELFKGKPKCPLQELQFTLIRIGVNETYLSFVHVLKDSFGYSALEKIKEEKIKILEELRESIESWSDV